MLNLQVFHVYDVVSETAKCTKCNNCENKLEILLQSNSDVQMFHYIKLFNDKIVSLEQNS